MIVPESVVVAAAGCVYKAYDGVLAAARASRYENANALAVALQYTMAQLAELEGILVAVVGEQPEGAPHGGT